MTFASCPIAATVLLAAALCLSARPVAAAALPGSASDATRVEFKAGEMARQSSSRSAALRNGGNAQIRMLLWYPAASSEAELPVDAGSPVFVAGTVAAKVPFADDLRHPLVLLSHGFGGTARQMTWLGAALARAGYVAVAVDHPGTNGIDGITAQGAYAPWERASDLSAALDLVLGDPALASHVDRDRVGVAGFSMGGFAAALIAGARADFGSFTAFCQSPRRDAICNKQVEFALDYAQRGPVLDAPAMAEIRGREKSDWRDTRIKAAFLIDPALGPALSAASLRQIRVPITVIYGTADTIAPPPSNALLIGNSIPGAALIPLQDVGHYDFLSECSKAARRQGVIYCQDGMGTTRQETHRRAAAAAIEFFDSALQAGH